MRAQAFDVPDFEAGPLHCALHITDGVEFAVGEHVAVDEARERFGLFTLAACEPASAAGCPSWRRIDCATAKPGKE